MTATDRKKPYSRLKLIKQLKKVRSLLDSDVKTAKTVLSRLIHQVEQKL